MAISFSKLVDFKLGLLRSAYNFGHEVSTMVSDHFDIARSKAKLPTAAADVALGAYFGYAGTASFVGAAAGIVAAAGLVATAPVSAIAGVVISGIMMGLSAMTVAASAGMLTSAGEKTGIVKSHAIESATAAIVAKVTAPVHGVFASAKPLTAQFHNAVTAKKQVAATATQKLNLKNVHFPKL